MKRLAIITTHPIQYYAPLFKLLHEKKHAKIRVFYTWGEDSSRKHDPGFNKHIEWDLPLLEGYPYEWVLNNAADPGSHHFFGIKNPKLIAQVDSWKPDAALVIGWAYQSHLQVMRHYKGKIPVYFRGDSTLLDEKPGLRMIFKKWFLKWVYSHTDQVFYAGTQNKKYFREYGVPDSRLSFTPHAVDNARFGEDRSVEAMKLRSTLGLTSDDIMVLFAGKLEAKKDPFLLLTAFLALDKKNAYLLFAGNGPMEGVLKSQSSDLKSHNIHFMDFQNQTQMPVLYQACDLFCLPSRGPNESWGLAINEAMACGKAVLASDKVGSAYDLIIGGKNGLTFQSGNLTDLKEKLEHLISNKTLLQLYGKQSKEIIIDWNYNNISSAIGTLVNQNKLI